MSGNRLVIVLNKHEAEVVEEISRKHSVWYIDGTIYNSGSGLNFSCAGLKADCLAVLFKIEKEEWLNSDQIKTYVSEEDGIERLLPSSMRFLVNRDYKRALISEEEEEAPILKIVIVDAESDPPLLYIMVK